MKIYIVVANAYTAVSKLFSFATGLGYVHIGVMIDPTEKRMYSFGRKNVKRPFPAGFIHEDMVAVTKRFPHTICKIFELEITENQHDRLMDDLNNNYRRNAARYRYNVAALPLLHVNIKCHRKRHYVCSQFCGKLLSDCGAVDFGKDISLIKPKDFFDIADTKLIFDGMMTDYLQSVQAPTTEEILV